MTQDALESKREQLEDLEKSEREARRLEEALSQGRPSTLRASSSQDVEGGGEDEGRPTRDENEARREEESVYLPPHPGPNPVKRRAPGMGLLSALSYTLHGMMDVDPETARRNTITKTRESISQVSEVVWAGNEIAANERWVAGGRAAPVGARPEVLKLDDPS